MLKPTVALTSILIVSAAAHSQVTHTSSYPFHGDSADDNFGISARLAGDVNNDGFDDFIVGAWRDDNNGSNSGSARVFSGRTGDILYHLDGSSAGDDFGVTVDGVGDVDQDGFDDFIVGARSDDNTGSNSGSATVFSGANGLALYLFNGDSAGDQLGYSVCGAGDINNDGVPDFAVGMFGDDDNGDFCGGARVYSGANGTVLYSFYGDTSGIGMGNAIAGAGDVNNDGFDDLIVAISRDTVNGPLSGSARVFSGATGAILYTFHGDSAGDLFGYSVGGAGDVNNDGFDDVIVGAWTDDNTGSESGSARVFSGATGAILYEWNGDSATDLLGSAVSGIGDVNQDGFDDLLVGAQLDDNNGASSGNARVYSGADGSILYSFDGFAAEEEFGNSVDGGGDLNNDGIPDFIIAAHYDDNNGLNSGSVRLFISSACPTPPAPCPGNANGDTIVNFDDINAVIANWLDTCP